MSSFVVSDDTINRILAVLRAACNDREHGYEIGYELAKVHISGLDGDLATVLQYRPADLGKVMFDLNISATSQRYPDAPADDLPGSSGPFYYRALDTPYIYGLKALHCWLYQCNEGNAPESELFKVMDERIGPRLAMAIVRDLDEYEEAPWD